MKRFILSMAIMGMATATTLADEGELTRGIGQYPGRLAEYSAPQMVKDFTYRNIALHRAVYTSSNADYNLTGHLVTDGLVADKAPVTLSVVTNEGRLPNRDNEKLTDGNLVTDLVIKGEKAFVEYRWEQLKVTVDTIRFVGEVAYQAELATKGYTIRVMGSRDGKRWEKLGEIKGKDLPGYGAKQLVSTDPNKFRDEVKLPLRMMKLAVPLKKRGAYAQLRVEYDMPGAVWWRLYEIDHGLLRPGEERFTINSMQWDVRNTSWLPSEHFTSVWRSKPEANQWLYVDLGTEADFDRVILHWQQRAQAGTIQVSNDAAQWHTVAPLSGGSEAVEEVACQGHGRYVRLLLTQPDASGFYGLSELQVMGRGGLHAEPAATLANAEGKEMLNRWQLRRDGTDQWIEATVPGTVLTSYMNIGAVPDNRYADNMRQISESFFNADFWYRTTIHHQPTNQRTYLNFDGINWKAEVTLNGQSVGRIDGAFIRGRFDVTDLLKAGDNLLEVHVIKNAHFGAVKEKTALNTDKNGGILGADNPTFHATIGWDWITSLPGREVGIWNDVYLTHDGGVRLYDPLVTTTLNLPDTLASMTPAVRVANEESIARRVKVVGHIGQITFEKEVTLQPMEQTEVTFTPEAYAQLRNQRMNLWWPNGYGDPYLYEAGFQVIDSTTGTELSQVRYKAGIRQMSYRDLDTRTTLYINGKRFNPLGGNWGFAETNLNYRGREYDVAVRYHREMNCTMIRNWVGQIGDEEFYEACDKYGIMVWQDFWLANPWDGPDPYDEAMFLANSTDYISRIRNHASIGIYVGRNEGYPPASIDKALRQQIQQLHPQLGYIPSSADDGVSGHGPYRMQPTAFYFNNQTQKLHSERGMPNVPTFESLSRMLNPAQLWPQGDAWGQHDFTLQGAQGGESFNATFASHFGQPRDARHFTALSQWLNYDGYRAMYESTQQYRMGLLIWMSHACWPSMVWCTYDYYFEPTAAYFGVKKACEPLHIQYNPVKQSAEVVNYAGGARQNLLAKAQILTMQGTLISEAEQTVAVAEDETLQALQLQLPTDQEVYYIRLYLKDGERMLSENFYVEGRQADELQALAQLPQAEVESTQSAFTLEGDEWKGTVTLTNRSETPALLLRLNLKGYDGEQILPVIYSDNYFALMPGESKTVTISYRNEDSRGALPVVEVTGFNKR